MRLGNHRDHIGYLKYDLDDDTIPVIMWAGISVGPAILLIAAVIVCILWTRRRWQCIGSRKHKRRHETANRVVGVPKKTRIVIQSTPTPVNDPSTNPDHPPLNQPHTLDDYLQSVPNYLALLVPDEQEFSDNKNTFRNKDSLLKGSNSATENRGLDGQHFGNPAVECITPYSNDMLGWGGKHGSLPRQDDKDLTTPCHRTKRETLNPQGNLQMLYHYKDERHVYEEKHGWAPHTEKEYGANQWSDGYQRGRQYPYGENREEMHPPPDYD